MRPAGFALLSWLALVGLWLLFVGTSAQAELYAGMAAATVAVLTLELTRRARLLAFRVDAPRLLGSWRHARRRRLRARAALTVSGGRIRGTGRPWRRYTVHALGLRSLKSASGD